MKKILATLLAVMMIASLCVVCASAWTDADEAVESGWTRHSIFDADLYDPDGTAVELPAEVGNGACFGTFQAFVGQGHLYEGNSLNTMSGGYFEFTFKGTGFRLGTSYRRPEDARASALEITVDGNDKTADLKDLFPASGDDNNTAHTIIYEVTGLEAGVHTIVFTSTAERYDLSYFEIKDEQEMTEEDKPAAKTGDALIAVVAVVVAAAAGVVLSKKH